jgi:peptidoglycan hydrolase-like protein with peptidoglycan-binding domain
MATLLKQGSRGPEVEQLQQMLHTMNYYGGNIDGQFEWRTHVAVTKYQHAAGLHADGEVGANTWASLSAASGPATGLRDHEHVQDYVDSSYGTMHGSMDPQVRLDQLMGAALQELGELSAPRPDYLFEPALSGTRTLAQFVNSAAQDKWRIEVNPDRFAENTIEHMNEQQLGEVANTLYHETRHCEMTFREARAQAGLGHNAAALVTAMDIPQRIADAAVANPINQSTADGASDEAIAGYESSYGTGSAATQAVYQSGDYQSYRQLYEEADAFEAGREVEVAWRHEGGVHGTVELHDHGDDVSYLQRGLTHLGFFHDTVSSAFEQSTHDAVVAFQHHYNMKEDGVCGELTWAQLAGVYSE